MVTTVSNIGIQTTTSAQLQNEMLTIEQLNEQLASGVQEQNLTDYSPTTAENLLDFQNAVTQRQSYISAIGTVQSRLSLYNTSLSDLESVANQAQQLASGNPTLNAGTLANITQQIGSYFQQVTDDLNQQIGGRYIYAGTRYNTAPVQNLSAVPATASYPFTPTTSPALPTYDSDYVGGLTMTPAGQTVTIAGTVNTPQTVSVTVNNTVYSYTVQAGDTPTTIAAGLSTALQTAFPGTTSAGAVLTLPAGATINAATPDSNVNAYTADSAYIDTGYSVQYGLTSTNPAFQQLIAGLQLMQQAVQSGSSTTYTTDMENASTLLQTAQTNLVAVNTNVAANVSTLQGAVSTQNADITNLQIQISNLSSVNTTNVSTEITALQAQLDASYQSTGTILKLSLANYL